MSQPVVSKICKKVAGTLARISHRYIKMPANIQEEESMRKFLSIVNFHTVIGAIDCMHIRMKKVLMVAYYILTGKDSLQLMYRWCVMQI